MFSRAGLILVLLFRTCAYAQETSDADYCAGSVGTVEERMSACTRAITSGQLSSEDLALAYFNRGLLWSEDEYDQAIDDYNEAIRLNPKSVRAYNSRGNAWSRKLDYDRAIADYDKAIQLDPQFAKAYSNRGAAWSKKVNYDRAIADEDEAIRLDPQLAPAYVNRGFAWGNKGNYDQAVADEDEAIRLNPKFALAYSYRGFAWGRKGNYDQAVADEDEAIRLDPQLAQAYFNRGFAWGKKGNNDHAIADYRDAIRLDPKFARDENFTSEICPGERNALILSGGGIRGAYQAGAIWYLVNVRGCHFSHFYGTSTGAVTAAFLSQAKDQDELKALVKDLVKQYKDMTPSDIVDEHFLGKIRVFYHRGLVAPMAYTRSNLSRHVL